MTAKIALHDERTDRDTVGGTETGIFDINRDGNLRIMIRGKAHESRVVATMGVLSRTGLAAHLYVREIGTLTRTEIGRAHV